MDPKDFATIIHPIIAVVFVFPLLGIVLNYAWQTRQRRLQTNAGKSKIPPSVGTEHLKLGRWLSNSVVGLALIGLAHEIIAQMLTDQAWRSDAFKVGFTILMFVVTIASLVFLNQARTKLWRGVFATLTGLGLVILGFLEVFLGFKDAVIYRRDAEWFWSHYYFGMAATMLMIFALAIFPDIYQDRTNTWRRVHVALNCIALLFFVGQGFTGTRDLLEIPLEWQKPYVEQLYIKNCQPPQAPGACTVEPASGKPK
jgi:multidrug transporter EmrE-like cation transporter